MSFNRFYIKLWILFLKYNMSAVFIHASDPRQERDKDNSANLKRRSISHQPLWVLWCQLKFRRSLVHGHTNLTCDKMRTKSQRLVKSNFASKLVLPNNKITTISSKTGTYIVFNRTWEDSVPHNSLGIWIQGSCCTHILQLNYLRLTIG